MNAHRFDILVTWVLLAFAGWYGAVMASYSGNAGRVPLICAAVMAAALVVQLVTLYRRGAGAGDPAVAEVPPDSGLEARIHTGIDASAAQPATAPHRARVDDGVHDEGDVAEHDTVADLKAAVAAFEPEPDSYDTLIALHGVRRRRFLTVAAFTVGFYIGFLLVGFVLTSGLLIAAVLLAARERMWVAVVGGLAGAGAAYALVVLLLHMAPLHGLLFT